MNLTIEVPKNWNPNCSLSFSKWYKEHVKGVFLITEDYYLLKL